MLKNDITAKKGPVFFTVLLGIFASCSLYVEAVPSDVLYINSWLERGVDFNPGGSYGFVASEQTAPNINGKRINPSIEPAVEFTTAIGRDGSLYLAYTTKVNSTQTVTIDSAGLDAAGKGMVSNIYTQSLETLTETQNISAARMFRKEGAVYTFMDVTTNTASIEQKTPETGVWVRVLRYDPAKSPNPWSVIFTTDRPAELTSLKLAFIPGRTFPFVAAISNNNRLTVFGKTASDQAVEYITSGTEGDLNGGRNPQSVSQISCFSDADRLYVSFIEDNRQVIGYIRNLQWQENYYDIWPGKTPNSFGMASSQGEVYGFWWNSGDQRSTISAYYTNAPAARRWLLVNSLTATQSPKIKSRYYTESGSAKLDVYVGYVYGATKYFQLSKVSNNQIYTSAPPVDGYNERYDFDIDSVGRVLYGRVNSNGTIDVGTWTRAVWRTAGQPEKILGEITAGSARAPYKVFPSSDINTIFIKNDRPFVIFIDDTGHLQMIEGLKALGG